MPGGSVLRRYVPEGLSAAEWAKMQKQAKDKKAANKLKYPKGAPQVVGVGKYLEDLRDAQTFRKDKAGNTRVDATGHKCGRGVRGILSLAREDRDPTG